MSDTNGLSRVQKERLLAAVWAKDPGAAITATVAAMLAEARAEVVRDFQEARLARHTPSAAAGAPVSDDRTESEEPDLRTSTGHTEAHRALCGEALGDMRCQLRRGHDGAHEDWSSAAPRFKIWGETTVRDGA